MKRRDIEKLLGLNSDQKVKTLYFSDKRAAEKCWKVSEKVVRLCHNERLALKNNPPFILDILPTTCSHLKAILDKHSHNLQELDNNEYLRLFVENLINKCNSVIQLFRDAREQIYDEKSMCRSQLTKHSLLFSHILHELQAIFPKEAPYDYTFVGEKFRITKHDAHEWWRTEFGTRVVVPWRTFKEHLDSVHSITSNLEAIALKTTIDLTCSEFVSIFEFDVFTRLFQPWSHLLQNWKALAVLHPGYLAFSTYDEVIQRLKNYLHKPGSFVYRQSCTKLGQWAIGYVTTDHQILQTIPTAKSLAMALYEGQREGYYLYPDGKEITKDLPDLKMLCESSGTVDHITVKEEQYMLYCEMGSTFQLCKICSERDKDIRLEPCQHLICSMCLLQWQEKDGQNCPFCRAEIKDTHKVSIEPFQKKQRPVSCMDSVASTSSNGSSLSMTSSATAGVKAPGLSRSPSPRPSGLDASTDWAVWREPIAGPSTASWAANGELAEYNVPSVALADRSDPTTPVPGPSNYVQMGHSASGVEPASAGDATLTVATANRSASGPASPDAGASAKMPPPIPPRRCSPLSSPLLGRRSGVSRAKSFMPSPEVADRHRQVLALKTRSEQSPVDVSGSLVNGSLAAAASSSLADGMSAQLSAQQALLAEGFAADAVAEALRITSNNIPMARQILRSFSLKTSST